MKNDYMWNTGNLLNEMRLIIEGAVVLFENDASVLMTLSMNAHEYAAFNAFDTIGEALYRLQKHIHSLHEAHTMEVQRQLRPDEET